MSDHPEQGVVRCDECGKLHRADYSHEGTYGEGPIYVVYCDQPEGLKDGQQVADYYTRERLYGLA